MIIMIVTYKVSECMSRSRSDTVLDVLSTERELNREDRNWHTLTPSFREKIKGRRRGQGNENTWDETGRKWRWRGCDERMTEGEGEREDEQEKRKEKTFHSSWESLERIQTWRNGCNWMLSKNSFTVREKGCIGSVSTLTEGLMKRKSECYRRCM